MAVEQGPMSGFRDMLAEQMIPRQEMISTVQGVYETYGFTPLKTPALERFSTLSGKYGEEGEKLMYKFTDNGGREVAMRYDQTVPLARVVAQYAGNIPMPYKRYAVGEVWRGDRPQAGRYREFTQFDADTVGTSSSMADAEVVAMMSDSMSALGVDSLIRVNNRRILDALVEAAKIPADADGMHLIGAIDKVDKIGNDAVVQQIAEEFGEKAAEVASDYLSIEGSPLERLRKTHQLLKGSDAADEGVENLSQVFNMLERSGYDGEKIVFDQTIARGLDYYTGIIYETNLKDALEIGSVCAGGRYDNLVKDLGGPDLPAVGTSIGVDRLFDGLQIMGKLKPVKTKTEVLVTNFQSDDSPEYMEVVTGLRNAGIPAEVYYDPAKLGKQLKFADKMGIPYAVIMGPDELAKGEGVIKDLVTGAQTRVAIDGLVRALTELRQHS